MDTITNRPVIGIDRPTKERAGGASGAPPASSGVVYGMAMTDKIRLTQYAAKSG